MLCLTAQLKKSNSYELDFLYKGYEKDIFRGLPLGFELKRGLCLKDEEAKIIILFQALLFGVAFAVLLFPIQALP